MKKLEGYLFSKMAAFGTRSEGRIYLLQFFDYKEVKIKKGNDLSPVDPQLDSYLDCKVRIEGDVVNDEIVYQKIGALPPQDGTQKLHLSLTLALLENVLWVNKMPPISTALDALKSTELKLFISWPHIGMWSGECPTNQLYEFEILDPAKKVIWTWGSCLKFVKKATKVEVRGDHGISFSVKWPYFDAAIEKQGAYTARAKFMASGDVVEKEFVVRFAM